VTIVLRSDELEVELTPERGADIRQIRDRATGMKFLAESPTSPGRPGVVPGNSMVHWLNGYPGGWQFLCPNADDARVHDGVEQGYHGEAALVEWMPSQPSESSCEFETTLVTAPLKLHRRVEVTGNVVEVTDSVTNLAPRDVTVQLVQHPAFGADFLGAGSYLVLDAGVLISDARGPGSLLASDLLTVPSALPPGPDLNSIALPEAGSGAAVFAAFAEFETPAATFVSPSTSIAVRMEWDRSVYPYAWFWVEANAGEGWPWFQRLYAAAVEPANVLPGTGAIGGYTRGADGTAIAGGGTLTSATRFRREPQTA
jgi:hypothetical protein